MAALWYRHSQRINTRQVKLVVFIQGEIGQIPDVPLTVVIIYPVINNGFYQAINESDEVHVFDLHQNPNDECIVGRHIRPVLTETFREVEEKAERQLKQTALADCMEKMRTRIGEDQ